jgi:tetratricopeptide (TPR) repeat protein
MAMRKAFTGGACAPGGEGQAMGNNAFTNMMDYMVSGGASAAQKAEGFGPQMDMGNMNAMEAAFAEQEKMEAMNKQFDSMQINQPPQQNMGMPQISQPNMEGMNSLWDQPITQEPVVKTQENAAKFSNMGHHPGMFGLPGMMGPMMHNPMHASGAMAGPAVAKEEVKVEEMPEVTKEDQQMRNDEIKEVSATIIQELNRVPSQKIQNSQFLQFMKKLNTGACEIKEDGLVEDPQKMKEFNEAEAKHKQMDAEWYKNKIDAIIEETKDPEYFKEEDAIKQKNFEDFDPTNLFRDVWDAGEMDEGELQRMMASWKTQAEKSMGYYDEVIDQPPVETIIEVPKVDHFKFEENNPYDGVDDAYTLALQLNEELKVHDAVLALKAHLTKEPDHAASWRLLGQLYQEKDEDDKAIAYFKRAYELDPYD